ncbi:MAG: hypothetical protein ABJA98_32125 [Acidobacteriota bacterium]
MSARSTRLVLPALLGLTVVVGAHPLPMGQPGGPGEKVLLGTWRLDLAKSKYFPGPAPRGETRIYTADRDGVRGVIKRIHADGHTEIIEYRANYDREQAVTGTPAYDAITLKRIDDHTSESVLSHAGMVYGTARRVISPDGNTMTIAFERKTTGETVRNVAVYRRAPN